VIAGKRFAIMLSAVLAGVGLAACGSSVPTGSTGGSGGGDRIRVVAAENEYGDVASQIGGSYVSVYSVESNPNTDPHTYELSPRVAASIGSASVIIQNGVGYDSFMQKIESASGGHHAVIDVQTLLGLPGDTPNPHLWYDPKTMPAVASALARDLSALQPAHAAYFAANADRFTASLAPWTAALAQFRSAHPGVPVATTEPVADYMLQAAGADNRTPFSFQADIMNGVDPAPQDVSLVTNLLRHGQVKALVYNQQVTDTITEGFIKDARQAGIPVVGVYETMPVPGYDYQSWMLTELHALDRAVTSGVSTQRL
jgi:zinc/manganese transport system substrate-binding protein